MNVAVVGLWHLGSVTAGCLAHLGHDVVGIDSSPATIAGLKRGEPPIAEGGLSALIDEGLRAGRLRFSTSVTYALASASVIWITLDTPVDDADRPDVDAVRRVIDEVAASITGDAVVLISSQVPVGFTRSCEDRWPGIRFAYSAENLRLGRAIEAFLHPDRIVVGVRSESDRRRIESMLAPLAAPIEWMGVESAEMTKHGVNAFLATSVAFINEIARLCEEVGADAREVARGMKSESRIGPRAYLSPGSAFAGGTLARDLRALTDRAMSMSQSTPLLSGVLSSNEQHRDWLHRQVARALATDGSRRIALLGLAYKPGTDTLRRSTAVELGKWLRERRHEVVGYDPMIPDCPPELKDAIHVTRTMEDCLRGADLAVVLTPCAEFRRLEERDVVSLMRRPTVIDPGYVLADSIAASPEIRYIATGRAA